jgi:hypothetical protein
LVPDFPRVPRAPRGFRFLPKVISGQAEADGNHDPANDVAVQPLGEMSAQIAAQNRRPGHGQGILPNDHPFGDKNHHRDAIDAGAQNVLEAVHLMDVRQTDETQGR